MRQPTLSALKGYDRTGVMKCLISETKGIAGVTATQSAGAAESLHVAQTPAKSYPDGETRNPQRHSSRMTRASVLTANSSPLRNASRMILTTVDRPCANRLAREPTSCRHSLRGGSVFMLYCILWNSWTKNCNVGLASLQKNSVYPSVKLLVVRSQCISGICLRWHLCRANCESGMCCLQRQCKNISSNPS